MTQYNFFQRVCQTSYYFPSPLPMHPILEMGTCQFTTLRTLPPPKIYDLASWLTFSM